MRTHIASVLLLTILTGSPVFAQQWATKMFATTAHDFGSVARDSKTEYEFKLKNLYLEDVHIAGVRSSCGCTTPRIKKAWLKSHEEGAIIAIVNTDIFRGAKGATLTVTIDKPMRAQVQLHVRTFIRDDVLLTPTSVQFGAVQQGTAVVKKLRVDFAGNSGWRILDVKSANGHLLGKVVRTRQGNGRVSCEILVRLDENTPAGDVQDHLMLVTNDPQRTAIPVLVNGQVTSGVTVSPAALNMGVVHPGGKVRKQLLVRGTKPFRIKEVTSDGDRFRFDTSPEAAPKSFHLIPVTFIAGSGPGKVVQTIRIETDLGGATTELLASALVSPQ